MVLAVQIRGEEEPRLLQHYNPGGRGCTVRPRVNLVGEREDEPRTETDGREHTNGTRGERAGKSDQACPKKVPTVALQKSMFEHACGRAVMFAKCGNHCAPQNGRLKAAKIVGHEMREA